MNRNMNAGRLLYMICLLAFSVVGGKLEAQTVVQPVEQQHDSIKYALSIRLVLTFVPVMWLRQIVSSKEIMRNRKGLTNHFPCI